MGVDFSEIVQKRFGGYWQILRVCMHIPMRECYRWIKYSQSPKFTPHQYFV